MTERWRNRIEAGVIVLITLIAYLPALRAGFIWDDDDHITNNVTLRSVGGLGEIWLNPQSIPQYYPLTHTVFWVEYHLWGENAAGYHAVSVMLHVADALLVLVLLRRLAVGGAFWTAAVFAAHPVLVETVAWATEQKTLLSALFYLLSFWSYLRFYEGPKGRVRFDHLSLFLFFCAMLSKTVACSLPGAILLVLWWKGKPIRVATVLNLIPFVVIGLVLGQVTAHLEISHVGARGAEWDFSAVQRVLIAGRALWFYAGKLIWPVGLSFNYRLWDVDGHQAWQWIFPIGAVGVIAGLLAAQRKIGRGPAAAVLFFAGTLVPALGFFDIYPMRYSFVADHFVYMASIGLFALSIGLAYRPLKAVMPAIPVGLAVLTFLRSEAFHDPKALWMDTLAKNPESAIAHFKIGKLMWETGDREGADREFAEAARFGTLLYEPREQLGNDYFARRQFGEAGRWYGEAAVLRPDDKTIRRLLAFSLAGEGEYSQALSEYQNAFGDLVPTLATAGDYEALVEPGVAQGKLPEAEEAVLKALTIDPQFSPAQRDLQRLIAQEASRL